MNFLAGLAGAFFKALLGAFVSSAEKKRAEQTQRDLGATETTSAVNKETADAERRASDAAVNADRGADLDDKLIRGDRQI